MTGAADQARPPRRLPGVGGVTIQPAWLSVENAQAYSGLCRTKVFSLVTAGQVRSAKVGKRRLIDRASLDAFLAQHVTDA